VGYFLSSAQKMIEEDLTERFRIEKRQLAPARKAGNDRRSCSHVSRRTAGNRISR
jgi:hypothetical protein